MLTLINQTTYFNIIYFDIIQDRSVALGVNWLPGRCEALSWILGIAYITSNLYQGCSHPFQITAGCGSQSNIEMFHIILCNYLFMNTYINSNTWGLFLLLLLGIISGGALGQNGSIICKTSTLPVVLEESLMLLSVI